MIMLGSDLVLAQSVRYLVQLPFLAHVTISGDVRNKLSIIIGTALEQLCCQRTHMFGEHIFLQSSKRFINHEICIVCWLQAAH